MDAAFPLVYRFKLPLGLRGQPCRIRDHGPARWDRDGMRVINAGGQLVSVEFTDGRIEVVSRSAVVSAASKLGRMTVARLARGDMSRKKAERRARRAQR